MRLQKFFYCLAVLSMAAQMQACNRPSEHQQDNSSTNPPVQSGVCEMDRSLNNYFEEVAPDKLDPSDSDTGILRERYVKVDLEALKSDLLAGASSIRLNLFSDQAIDVTVEKIQKASADEIVLTGRIADEPLSSVALAIHHDVVVATVNPFDEKHFRITYTGGGIHKIQKAIDTEGENESSCLAEHVMEAPGNEHDVAPESDENFGVSATPVIDMLVTYTPAAKTAAGGDNAIQALIKTAVANTNKAYADSGVQLSVRLVGTMALTQNESTDFSADLSALRSKTDGKWDQVHAERARLGADQVTVIGNYPNNSVAGIGYVKSSYASAFAIVKRSAFSMYTFSHELGHNIGLNHSDGYVNASGGFRTIMAYGTYPRIIRFSNPNIPYKSFQTGTTANNSASLINAYGGAIAALATPKVTSPVTEEVPVDNKPVPVCPN